MDVRNYCVECDMAKPCECPEDNSDEGIAKREIEKDIKLFKEEAIKLYKEGKLWKLVQLKQKEETYAK